MQGGSFPSLKAKGKKNVQMKGHFDSIEVQITLGLSSSPFLKTIIEELLKSELR